ncbi:protein max isoform X2 [Lepisosteus oculatus]|uniref:protein max isoform X2 n=1 Tax=Lepisosteus oculatus TaxID=7918 RepID=UPI0003EA9203|nr:PREDICTED: protein max isoform X2 [Lepisosteus oculatus]
MSDNDDIEVDSDEESPRFHSVADKRAHHNALERKRRDHIKDSFHSLRDSVPALQGEKASRAQILDKATEYIQYMRRKNHTHQQDIDDLKRQNALLEQQVRALEKAKGNTQLQASYSSSDSSLYTNPKGSAVSAFDGGSDSSSDSESDGRRKKPRVDAN